MRGTQVKKIRRWYNQSVADRLRQEHSYFVEALKVRPKRLPLWLWKILAKIFYTGSYYNALVHTKGRVGEKKIKKFTDRVKGSLTKEKQGGNMER